MEASLFSIGNDIASCSSGNSTTACMASTLPDFTPNFRRASSVENEIPIKAASAELYGLDAPSLSFSSSGPAEEQYRLAALQEQLHQQAHGTQFDQYAQLQQFLVPQQQQPEDIMLQSSLNNFLQGGMGQPSVPPHVAGPLQGPLTGSPPLAVPPAIPPVPLAPFCTGPLPGAVYGALGGPAAAAALNAQAQASLAATLAALQLQRDLAAYQLSVSPFTCTQPMCYHCGSAVHNWSKCTQLSLLPEVVRLQYIEQYKRITDAEKRLDKDRRRLARNQCMYRL